MGKVRVGSVVEGMINSSLGPIEREGRVVDTSPPGGLSIDNVRVEDSGNPTLNEPESRLRVQFTVDTRTPGDRSGTLTLRVGEQTREIPFSVSVVERSETAVRALVLDPIYSAGTPSEKTLSLWADLVEAADLDPDYVDLRPPRSPLAGRNLDDYDVVLVSSKALLSRGYEAHIEALEAYVERGGRLILFAGGQLPALVEATQPLLDKLGVKLQTPYAFGSPSGGVSEEGQIAVDLWTEDVRRIKWGDVTSVTVVDPAKARLLVVHPRGDGRSGMVSVSRLGEGEVIVVCEAQPWFWLGRTDREDVYNAVFLRRLLTAGLPRAEENTSLIAKPTELHLGQVRKGATVGGSVGLDFGDLDKVGAAVAVEPPEGMTIERSEFISATHNVNGAQVPMTYLRISFSVDTREVGSRSGVLRATLGGEMREIPFSANVVESSGSATRIHVVDPPFSDHRLSAATLEKWNDLLASGNFDPQYVDFLPPRVYFINRGLDKCDVAVVSTRALMMAGENDVAYLTEWVRNGGRAVLFLQGDFPKALAAAEPLTKESGLYVESVLRRFPGVGGRIDESHIAADPLTEGVAALGWLAPSPIGLSPGSTARLLALDPDDGQKGFVAIGKVGKGEVVVVSEGHIWHWLGRLEGSNSALLRNLLTVELPREQAEEASPQQSAEATP
jgi:hypothetical protein